MTSTSSSRGIMTRSQKMLLLLMLLTLLLEQVVVLVVGIGRRNSISSRRRGGGEPGHRSSSSSSSSRQRILQMLITRTMLIDHAKRPDAVQEIGPGVVDRHARVVRILSPTLGGQRAQIVPDLMLLRPVDWWDPDMACIVHRLEFGPLIRRRPIAKRMACHRQR